MNKNELVKEIVQRVKGTNSKGAKATKESGGTTGSGGTHLKPVDTFLDAFFGTVSDELRKKGKVTLVGFGTFTVAKRKEKRGVNPKTGAKITIKGKSVPVFKPGKKLKMVVNYAETKSLSRKGV
ncbi:MAG: DNA-binding protein HU-beta [Acidobacteriota bacterium]|nr:DNA-binding protein HU-beta [Acidobacteriota bacterium]